MFDKFFAPRGGLVEKLPQVKGKYIENAKLSKHTWFGVGGPAEVMYIPYDEEDLKLFLLKKPEALPLTVIGGGSNLLVRDGGIVGVVIKLDSQSFKNVKVEGTEITVGAGALNSDLKKVMIENKIGGLEFLTSVPGRVGGLLRTNAGCFGASVSDVLVRARVMNDWGEMHEVGKDDFNFSYRSSMFPENWIVLEATFKGVKAKASDIQKTIEEHKKYREANQPINKRTAGSTFKNPE